MDLINQFHDDYLRFDAPTHSYTWCGIPLLSVTTLVESLKRGFNADKVSRRVAKRYGQKQSEILSDWVEKRQKAANLGNEVHSFAEERVYEFSKFSCINVNFSSDDSLSVRRSRGFKIGILRYFNNHIDVFDKLSIPEVKVCYPEYFIAGTVDFICSLDGLRSIIDWKTNRNIYFDGYDKMRRPITHLKDCNWTHYCLQMNIYRKILTEVYDYEVEKMVLVWLDGNGDYCDYVIPRMEEECEKVLDWHFNNVMLQN